MRQGKLAMTVEQSAVGQARASVMVARNMVEGKPLNEGTGYEIASASDRIVYVPFVPMTKEDLK